MRHKPGKLFFALMLFLSACTPNSNQVNYVTVPASDKTDPTVGMTINDNTVNINIDNESKPITFETGSGVIPIIVGATDPEGIKAVRLWKRITKYNSTNVEGTGIPSVPEKEDVSTAKVGESTLKNRFFQYNLDLSQELGSWTYIKIDVWAEGENFYGDIVTTPKVSIKYPKDPSPDVTSVCATSGGPPVIKLTDDVIMAAQEPGRQKIRYHMQNQVDTLLIIVDDAPELALNQIKVEVDIDPANRVVQNKAIEAWDFCHRGSRVDVVEASTMAGYNIRIPCLSLNDTNDFRSECTNTQTMVLNRSTTNELWLRKKDLLGFWVDVEVIDSSIWEAFSGRSVRFIWKFDAPPTP